MEMGEFREQLRGELARRNRVNPRYSLRAFARQAGLSPAFLSKVLRGTKNLSPARAEAVAGKLGYATPGIASLDLEAFQVISDWYHTALLELATTKGFRPEAAWIARKLGVTTDEVRGALARLVRLGLLRKERGSYVKTDAFLATPTDRPNQAIRNFHAQMLVKARQALDEQDVSQRDFGGSTIAIDPAKLELAKKEIRKFRLRLMKLLDSDKPTAVYQFNTQLFKLGDSE